MTRIEGAPFKGDWKKIGRQRHSSDSCVGRVGPGVVKWARTRLQTRQELLMMCKFRKRSDELYRQALGEFVVPSLFVAGEKLQGRGREYKPYIIQPFLNCWTGKTVPENVKTSRKVCDQWAVLYSRLYGLYQTADEVNRGLEQKEKFPVTLTLGSTRRITRRLTKGESMVDLPRTDNLLIEKMEKRLYVCDFGPYLEWEDEMAQAYNQILKRIEERLV